LPLFGNRRIYGLPVPFLAIPALPQPRLRQVKRERASTVDADSILSTFG